MRIVLDTGVFFRPDALRRLAKLPHHVVVPTVVLAERARHLAKAGRDPRELLEVLDTLAFHVEPLGAREALAIAPGLHDDATWKRSARDALIAGHVRGDDVLWTTNARDFVALGLAEDRVLAV